MVFFSHNSTSCTYIKGLVLPQWTLGYLWVKQNNFGAIFFTKCMCNQVSPIMSVLATVKRPTAAIANKRMPQVGSSDYLHSAHVHNCVLWCWANFGDFLSVSRFPPKLPCTFLIIWSYMPVACFSTFFYGYHYGGSYMEPPDFVWWN